MKTLDPVVAPAKAGAQGIVAPAKAGAQGIVAPAKAGAQLGSGLRRNDEKGRRNDEKGRRNDEKGRRNDEKGRRNDGKVPRAADERTDDSGAVPKALRVLEAVAARKRPLSIAEIAAALDMPQPTAHRIVGTLERLGFIGREPGRRRIVEGSRLVGLGLDVLHAAAGSGTRHAILAALAAKTGESCNLGVVSGGHVVYIDRVESQWPLGLRFEPGSKVPLHCTAIGKLMLSQMPQPLVEAHLAAGKLVRYTATTITDAKRLKDELARIRRQGYSIDNQEFMSGVVCMAVPVKGMRGEACAGLAISAAQARLTLAGVKRYLPDLQSSAARLARALTADGGAPRK